MDGLRSKYGVVEIKIEDVDIDIGKRNTREYIKSVPGTSYYVDQLVTTYTTVWYHNIQISGFDKVVKSAGCWCCRQACCIEIDEFTWIIHSIEKVELSIYRIKFLIN